MYHDHLRVDRSGGFIQSVSVFEVLERKLFPLRIPGDGFVDDAESGFGAAGKCDQGSQKED